MSSVKSDKSSRTNDFKAQEGFVNNLSEIHEYQLKEAYLATYIASGVAPETAKVGVPKPATTEKPVKASRFSFRAAAPPAESSYTLSDCIKELKTSVGSLTQDEILPGFKNAARCDHPDSLMLRYLRARKWEIPKGLAQLGRTLLWRNKDWNIAELLERGEEYYITTEPDEGFINQYKAGKVTLHGHDKQGRPLVFIHVAKHDPKAQSDEAMERYTLNTIENARLCTSIEIESAAVVFDLGGFGLGNMDYNVVKFILSCFEQYYPECLGYLFIHRAPWVFSSVWNIIKGWIDPVVASKISFTKNEADLLKFVDNDQIPEDLGGASKFEYEWIAPKEGENKYLTLVDEKKAKLKEREALYAKFDALTLKWIATANKSESDSVYAERNKIVDEIFKQYWELDPYIRSRTICDRNGSLGEFKPQLKAGGVAQPTL